jgi:metallo-beta-lactamase family protein
MYLIWQLRKEDRIPDVPYILDTPMGISVLSIFRNHTKWHKLSAEDCTEMCALFTLVHDYEDTLQAIADRNLKW